MTAFAFFIIPVTFYAIETLSGSKPGAKDATNPEPPKSSTTAA